MSQTIDYRLLDAIGKLNAKQKKELLAYVDTFLHHPLPSKSKWDDEGFVTEMEKRLNYYESGGQMITAEQSTRRIKEILDKAGK